MRKKVFLFLIISVMLFPIITNAESLLKTIDVLFNPFNIYVNDQELITEHFVYNDTTYVPLRAVTEGLNMDVKWDAVANKINIAQKDDKDNIKTDSKFPELVSLINLIATPEKYNGKFVEVDGYYCILDFESFGLFLTADDARNYISKNSVDVIFKEGALSAAVKEGVDFSEPVLVSIEGIYNQNSRETQCGTIENATLSRIY